MGEFPEVFARNLLTWGPEKQQQLVDACILVAGVGGLGSTVAELLVRAGVGKLVLLDVGVVDEPDLNRQIQYTSDDLGKRKVGVAAQKLSAIHQHTTIIPINRRLEDDAQLFELLWQQKFLGIADCFDNFSSRFALECLLRDETFLVHGGVQSDYGQLTTIQPGITKSLRALFPNVEDAKSPLPVCPQIVSCVAAMMAHEVMNAIWGVPQLLNTFLIVELSDFSFSKIDIR